VTEITARGVAEQALGAAEARFRDLIESAPDAIVLVNAEGEIVLFNAQTEALFGYTREELLAMPVESLLSDGIGDLQGYRRQEAFAASGARSTGQLTRASALRKDGTKVAVEISVSPLAGPEGTLACVWIRDVSVGGETEQVNERLGALVDSSDDAIIDTQLDGTIVGWNAAAERIYGYGAEEAIGRPISILVAPERSDELAVILERIAEGERIDHYETVGVCKDGRRVEVSISVSPINDEHGAIIGAATIARDVTERKRAEDSIRMVLESMPDAIVVVADDGRIEIINRRTEELFGYARDQLLGQRGGVALPERLHGSGPRPTPAIALRTRRPLGGRPDRDHGVAKGRQRGSRRGRRRPACHPAGNARVCVDQRRQRAWRDGEGEPVASRGCAVIG
jgi:PAS domain S-box-containing protein